jgi:hypothetical protein
MKAFKEQTREKANNWLEEIRYLPPLLETDFKEIKSHLLEEVDGLKQYEGLKEEDALDIALFRIGNRGFLKRIYNDVNAPLLQMQRVILPAAGVLFFFLCFYCMQFIGQLLYGLNFIFKQQPGSLTPTYTFLISYHLFFVFLSFYLFRKGQHFLPRFDWVLKPVHICGLFIAMFTLSSGNLLLSRTIDLGMENLNLSNPLYHLWGFIEYSFPMVFIACFFLLYFRYNRLLDVKYSGIENDLYLRKRTGLKDSIIPVREEQAQKYWNEGMEYLYEHTRFNENEALILEMRKKGYELTPWNFCRWGKGDYFMKAFLKMLSGILIYFILYYFLCSTARFFIWCIQEISGSPLLSIKNAWTLVISGYLLILFFTSSIFLLDQQLLQRIKKLRLNNHNLLKSFFLLILLGSAERIGTLLSQQAMSTAGLEANIRMEKLFEFLHYTFPLLICVCFLILFLRYYWKQFNKNLNYLLSGKND